MAKLYYKDKNVMKHFLEWYYKENTVPTFTNPKIQEIVKKYETIFNKEKYIEVEE